MATHETGAAAMLANAAVERFVAGQHGAVIRPGDARYERRDGCGMAGSTGIPP